MLRETMQKNILSLWYVDQEVKKKHNITATFVWICLLFLSCFYAGFIKLRAYLYNREILKSFKINVPVIIVGNITVGGNGKTPVVIALIKLLQEHGYKPGVILRGYGVKKNTIKQMKLVDQYSTVGQHGDEALLIYNNTGCSLVVSVDRVAAAKFLVANNLCDIILSDDGLQHYRLQRNLEICVIDADRQFGNNCLIPAGPLREPVDRLNKVNYILTKTAEDNYNEIKASRNNKEFIFALPPSCFIHVKSKRQYSVAQLVSSLFEKNIFIYAGIGNNNSFIKLLASLFLPFNFEISKNNTYAFPDHYNYRADDFAILNDNNNIIITTEKDAVRMASLEKGINNFNNIFYLAVSAALPAEFTSIFLGAIKKLIN